MRELSKQDQNEIITEILQMLPKENKEENKKKISDITVLFEGQEMNTLGVLYNAAEKRKFEEFYKRLNDYYEKEGKDVSVQNRGYARNVGQIILEDVLKKETEIANKDRDEKDRKYWPRSVQTLAMHLGSVKMELFFLYCLQEITHKK